jgi:O-antigen biosynthesis protein WbqV
LTAIAKLLFRGLIRFWSIVLSYWIATGAVFSTAAIASALDVVWFYGALFAVIGPFADYSVGLRRAHWRYISMHDLMALMRSAVLALLALVVAIFIIDRGWQMPRSTLILAFFLDLGLTAGMLILRRILHEGGFNGLLQTAISGTLRRRSAVALMLVGSPDEADAFLKGQPREDSLTYQAVGIIAETRQSLGQSVRGVPVIGITDEIVPVLGTFADRGGPKAVVFLGREAHTLLSSEAAASLLQEGVKLLRAPRLTDLSEQASGNLREINVEELLPRDPVRMDLDRVRALVAGKRIMVTGAGGSIGSELCRQVTALGCAHISLLDNSEYLLFTIESEIATHRPTLSRREILCDVRDPARVRGWVEAEKPDIIFHAAALKHVPLVERHPAEGALTNIVGTWNVADAAHRSNVQHMVFISTDKAVEPSNVMGATKRLAESVIRTHQTRGPTRFSVVRFGNVLGSHGSVVPTFLRQIEQGGPVTVTHPDVERFFMTIPEAVQLVLHATARSTDFSSANAGVFVLDMGKPVKIMDLARQLISLRGKVPGKDIAIEITGLRPGEKLSEELVDSSEVGEATDDGIIHVTDRLKSTPLNAKVVTQLEKLASAGDNDAVRGMVFELLAAVRQTPQARNRPESAK